MAEEIAPMWNITIKATTVEYGDVTLDLSTNSYSVSVDAGWQDNKKPVTSQVLLSILNEVVGKSYYKLKETLCYEREMVSRK